MANFSQFKSKIRQIEQKQRQAINNYNRAVSNYNRQLNQKITAYNQAVRKYNDNVRRNRQIIQNGIRKLNNTHVNNYLISVNNLQQYYTKINRTYIEGCNVAEEESKVLDLIEQENANNIITANYLENDITPEEDTNNIQIGNKLKDVSFDLDNRWKGAIFSLNPNNPDATRHFCTSTREIFTFFIEIKAPDSAVFKYNASCAITEKGTPTRKEKIKYIMRNKTSDPNIISFADENIENILQLFHILSDGTHGEAGKYSFSKLMQVKKRVESGLNFLCEISV